MTLEETPTNVRYMDAKATADALAHRIASRTAHGLPLSAGNLADYLDALAVLDDIDREMFPA